MKRDIGKLAETEFDVIIIGGGIYGATAAWDASLRGLKVALVEKGDFAGATSSNSLKIIHGGLRYIQQADVKRMRESIRERRVLMSIAPHLVHPLPCIMPLYGHLGKGPEVMRIALLLNDLVGFDRNRIADPQKILPNGKVISKNECLELLPGIREQNLTGGALWYDCQVYNSERMLISFLHSAVENGAVIANYCATQEVLIQDRRVVGVKVKDQLSNQVFDIHGKMTLNTSGPWTAEIMKSLKPGQSNSNIKLSWAMNIVTRQLFSNYAAGISGKRKIQLNGEWVEKGSKVFFVTPWRDYSIVGTIHEPYQGNPSDFKIKQSYVNQFVQEINDALPGKHLEKEDICFFYGGLLPMERPNAKTGEVVLTKHYKIYDHSRSDNIEGIISTLGVKYTTARDVSQKLIDLVMKKLGRSTASQADSTPVFGGSIQRFDEFQQQAIKQFRDQLPEKVITQLVYNYGSEYQRILRYGETNTDWLVPIQNTTVLPAEVIHAVREEMANHLIDVVWRRTELGSAGHPGSEALQAVSRLMAKELDWDEKKRQQEIALTEAVYVPLQE